MTGRTPAAILGLGLGLAGILLVAGCSDAPATQLPAQKCRIRDFLGDWVNTRRADEGVSVDGRGVTVIAGSARTRIGYVAARDFGLVSRQVLRQEFANLATLRSLPPARGGRDETVCSIHLIRKGGAAALVANGDKALVFLEESGIADPPATMHLRRGKPRRAAAPGLLTPPT